MNNKTEMLFPPRLIPELRELRGEGWGKLVDEISILPADNPRRLAFVLMMVRLGGCTTCYADSFWAMQGCAKCSRSTISRYKGSDQDLAGKFETALADVEKNRPASR